MLEINNNIVNEPIIDILYKLRRDLLIHNISKLSDIQIKGDNALVSCPIHKGGQELHASCYVKLKDDGKVKEGVVHCFTCGYKSDFFTFISNCFNLDGETFGKEWLLNNCSCTQLIQSERKILKIEQKPFEKENTQTYVSEEELKSYRYYHPYMFERKLTEDVINKYDIGYDKKTQCITFPVFDINNNCLFVVKRSVNFKKFYIPEGVEKYIFGLNHIPNPCNELIICESVFNALTAIRYGYKAVALFGTGSKEQYKLLKSFNIRSYVLCFDGDNAGRKGALNFKKNIKNSIIFEMKLPEGKDANDLTQEEFEFFYKQAKNTL